MLAPFKHPPRAGQYRILYCDPPWFYSDRKCGNTKFGKGSVGNYGTLHTATLAAMPVQRWADPRGSVIFMWATWPNLLEALRLMDAWGYDYTTVAFVWVKTNVTATHTLFSGTGYWPKSNTEICLLGYRGCYPRPVNPDGDPDRRHSVKQIVLDPDNLELSIHGDLVIHPRIPEPHSCKPHEVRRRIVEMMGDIPRLEIFTRPGYPHQEGWDCFGNEIDPAHTIRELEEEAG